MGETGNRLRIGILGASDVAQMTLINPAHETDEVVVAAVGARDKLKAQAFADKYGIPRAYGSYDELIADPDLDAVYVVVPPSMHGKWTRAALAGGKHVFCEKPFTANADEARDIAKLAANSGRVVMEACQFRYHPLTLRVEQIIGSGELGKLQSVEVNLCVMLRDFSGNRYNFDLAGGASMDAGSYVVHMLRTFGGSTPEVVSAQAKQARDPRVDRAMTANVRYADGHTGRLRCALWSSNLIRASAKVVGEHGELRWLSPAAPDVFPHLRVRSAGARRVEHFPRRPSYSYQLDAFADAVLGREPVRTTPEEAVENMTVIDEMYRAAGLPVRMPS